MREMALTSSCLILVIALLRRVLRGRISPRVVYALWLLAAARLLIPGALFPAPVSVVGAAQELRVALRPVGDPSDSPAGPLPDAPAAYPALSLDGSVPPEPETPAGPQTPEAAAPRLNWPEAVWAAGACLTGGALVCSNLAFALRLRRRRTRLELDTASWSGPLPVYFVEELDSPCLFGLLRPAIYLNREALEKGSLAHILTHEYTHFRHLDHLWALLRGICVTLHWFNPLVWWGAVLCRRDCELACDEASIRRLGEAERIAYGQTLLRMVSRRPVSPLHTATTMTAGRRTMAERIALIAHRPRTLGLSLAAAAVVMGGAVVLTFGGVAQAARDPSPAREPSPASSPAPDAGQSAPLPEAPEPVPPPESAGGVRTLSSTGYTHTSGLFSLSLPESWLGRVVCVESEDGAAFYDAGRYAPDTGGGWLMGIAPQPESWAAQYHRNDFILDSLAFSDSPYVYVLDVDQEPDQAGLDLAPLEVQEAVAGGFRLLADRESFPRLIRESYRDNMPLAVAYLPYLRWSDYRDTCGQEEMERLLEALCQFVQESDVSWGQVHDILSNRSRSDPAIDGAYAAAIQEGILWPLYEKNPQRFASVMGSVYLTDEERADVVEWLRYPLSERAGRVDSAEDFLTDEEVYRALGLTTLPGVSANYTDVTLPAAGDTFSLQPVNVSGIYAVSYASDNPEVAAVEGLEGTVTAVGPGMTTVHMHVECSAGQYDFACTVRCAWDEGETSAPAPDPETVNSWQRAFFGLMFSIPAAPDQKLVYDSLEADGLERAVLACLEDYARQYLETYGSQESNDRLSRIVLESELPQSPAYGAEVVVRYRIEGLRDREWNGETYAVAPQMGGPLETTFTVMDSLNYQNAIRFEAMNQPAMNQPS